MTHFVTRPLLLLAAFAMLAAAQLNFTNPVLPAGADPYVIQRDGYYYYTQTTGTNITLWKTRDIGALASATKRVVWTPPESGPYSRHIWAPELHLLGDRWYLYFAADDGSNEHHRIFVLENGTRDPLSGDWTLKGKLSDPGDHWAIDPTVFENRGREYLLWSGWRGATNGQQNIYIAALMNPWTMKGDRVELSAPEFSWERAGDTKLVLQGDDSPSSSRHDPIHVDVNEAPEMLRHGHTLFLIYSASACWTDWYELGMLSVPDDSDLLNPSSWRKSPSPLLWQSAVAHAFGTGHNGFFKSHDGKQDWIIYHANPEPGEGCGGSRSPRAQPFEWNEDGTPNFGRPVALGQPIPHP